MIQSMAADAQAGVAPDLHVAAGVSRTLHAPTGRAFGGQPRPSTRQRGRNHRGGADEDRQLLLAVLSGSCGWRRAAAAVESVMAAYGSFADAVAADEQALAEITALGSEGAAQLKAIHAAALRLAFVRMQHRPILRNKAALNSYLQTSYARCTTEQLRVLFLDARNRLIADEAMGSGDVRGVALYPGQVLRRALALHATALILVHNHPSGDPTPSEADLTMTRDLDRAAQAVAIVLHDHIIVGRGSESSFRALGLL